MIEISLECPQKFNLLSQRTGVLSEFKRNMVDRTGFEPVASRTLVRWQLLARIAKRALCQSELPALASFFY